MDEVLINGRRYRVPEKVIVLDFWNKLNKSNEHLQGCVLSSSFAELEFNYDFTSHNDGAVSGLSSPLTELSSLDDEDDTTSSQFSPIVNGDFDEHSAAKVSSLTFKFLVTSTKLHKVLCGLSSKRRGNFTNALALHGLSKILVDKSVQTESDSHVNSPAAVKNKVGRPRKVRQIFNIFGVVYNLF